MPKPVTRGLVESPEQWRWSSFRFYELDDRSVLAMDWDGRWPIEWQPGESRIEPPGRQTWASQPGRPT